MINFEYNKIRPALILSLGLAPLSMLAQVHVSGRVLDENKKPLPYANVRLTDHDGKLIGGQATDNQGLFNLPNIKAGDYTLEVSFTGYQTHKEQLKLHTSTPKFRVKDISLKDGSLLKEVTVTGKATEIILKGDTIEYNAGSFAPAEGAELLELIKKLPGAQVDESGNVKINGKSISQIMVDGKRFFESDPKVALKNLPAELVDKVQVLERESDNSRMTGFSDGSEETVINLTIKPGRKQGLFGTVYAGGGTKNRYEGNGIINRFSDKQQWTIIGGLNNTNNAGFSDIASDLSRSDIAQQASGSARRPWGDCVDMLRRFGKDIHSPKYVCPENLQEAHDTAQRKLQTKQDKEAETRRRQQAIENEERFQELKSPFFGITFTDGVIQVKVLESVQEYLEEGKALLHCVFTNEYYLKEQSLILSARIEGKRIETIEALETMKVIQCRGLQNKNTEYHDRIIDLVHRNIKQIKSRIA